MAQEYTPYQRNVIRRYYENADAIRAQKLGELVTEIYLAETDRRRDALWARAAKLLLPKDTPPDEAQALQAILDARDVEALAELAGQRFG